MPSLLFQPTLTINPLLSIHFFLLKLEYRGLIGYSYKRECLKARPFFSVQSGLLGSREIYPNAEKKELLNSGGSVKL